MGIWDYWFNPHHRYFIYPKVIACFVLFVGIMVLELWNLQYIIAMSAALDVLSAVLFYQAVGYLLLSYSALIVVKFFFEKNLVRLRRFWRITLTMRVLRDPRFVSLLESNEKKQSDWVLALQKSSVQFPELLTVFFKTLKGLCQLIIDGYILYHFAFSYTLGFLVIHRAPLILTIVYSIVVNVGSAYLGKLTQDERFKSDSAEAALSQQLNQDARQITAIRRTYQAGVDFIKRSCIHFNRAVLAAIGAFDQGLWGELFRIFFVGLISVVPWMIMAPAVLSGQCRIAFALVFIRSFYKVYYNTSNIIYDFMYTPLFNAYRRLRSFFKDLNNQKPTLKVRHHAQKGNQPQIVSRYKVANVERPIEKTLVFTKRRVWVKGDNASGKSTWLAALLGEVSCEGQDNYVDIYGFSRLFSWGEAAVKVDVNVLDYIFVPCIDTQEEADNFALIRSFNPSWSELQAIDFKAKRSLQDIRWVEDQLKHVGLDKSILDMPFAKPHLSEGQMQKIHFLRGAYRAYHSMQEEKALLGKSHGQTLVILDEVTEHGDDKMLSGIEKILASFLPDGCYRLVTNHHLNDHLAQEIGMHTIGFKANA